MTKFLTEFWLETIMSGILAILAGLCRFLYKSYKNEKNITRVEQDAVKSGVKSLLRSEINRLHLEYTVKKLIPVYVLETTNELYKQYVSLCSDSNDKTTQRLVDDLNELQIDHRAYINNESKKTAK